MPPILNIVKTGQAPTQRYVTFQTSNFDHNIGHLDGALLAMVILVLKMGLLDVQ